MFIVMKALWWGYSASPDKGKAVWDDLVESPFLYQELSKVDIIRD